MRIEFLMELTAQIVYGSSPHHQDFKSYIRQRNLPLVRDLKGKHIKLFAVRRVLQDTKIHMKTNVKV